MARASGCFEYCSREAAKQSTSVGETPGRQIWSVSFGSPYVSVPVLSKMMVRQESICSSTAGFLMMMARFAASEIVPMMATGIAINNGHGVATTSTARNRSASPLSSQAASAMARAAGV